MRRVLALDTSTWWGGVALVEHGDGDATPQIVSEIGLRACESHAGRLLSLFDVLLSGAGWPKSSVDAYAATRGPGSFTGIRVGLGTIRGLALASGRPCFGVGTLNAMADALGPATGDRIPLLDAGRDEVYGARFDPSETPPRERTAPWLGPPETALEGLVSPAVIFGSGAEVHRDRLRAAGWTGIVARAPTSVAAAVGRLAALLMAGGAPSGEGMSPLYLRPPDAETHRRTS